MIDIILNGNVGRIEAKYHHSRHKDAHIAVVLHPNPVYGGTMNNRIVGAMCRALIDSNFSVVKFNFRGVGKSEGIYDKGDGELTDTAAVLDWLQEVNPGKHKIWITGFAFGAWVGMQLLMRRPEIFGFIAVSPPANVSDFSFLAPCPVSGMIVAGKNDQVCSLQCIDKLITKLNSQRGVDIEYNIIQDADHSFRNHVGDVQTLIKNYVSRKVNPNFEYKNKIA